LAWAAQNAEARSDGGGGVKGNDPDRNSNTNARRSNPRILELGEEAVVNAARPPLAVPELWHWASLYGHIKWMRVG
jgi:hypothetical protein